jgi:hypothetical protein
LAYCTFSPDDIWGWLWSNWWSERRLQEKPKYSEKTCPSATLPHHKSHMPRSCFEPRIAAVGSQRLTAWAMARPFLSPISSPLTTRRVTVEVFDPASTRVTSWNYWTYFNIYILPVWE